MHLFSKRAQSIIEYTVVFCSILAALLIMQVYIKRCYSGKIKQQMDEVGPQYGPGHTTSVISTTTVTATETYTGGKTDPSGLLQKEVAVPDGETVSFSTSSTQLEKREGVDSFAAE